MGGSGYLYRHVFPQSQGAVAASGHRHRVGTAGFPGQIQPVGVSVGAVRPGEVYEHLIEWQFGPGPDNLM
jgi:hypothetical protein